MEVLWAKFCFGLLALIAAVLLVVMDLYSEKGKPLFVRSISINSVFKEILNFPKLYWFLFINYLLTTTIRNALLVLIYKYFLNQSSFFTYSIINESIFFFLIHLIKLIKLGKSIVIVVKVWQKSLIILIISLVYQYF